MKETGKWIHKQEELLYLMELNWRCVAIAPATQLQDKSDQHKLLSGLCTGDRFYPITKVP